MSFPGRPFGLPGFAAAVPGATIAGGGPFNPHMPGGVFVPATQVGLIPAPPGVIRTTAPIQIRSTPPVHISSKPPENNEEKKDGPEAPKTTVFVGNISEKAPDVLVRQLLAKCGVVLNWKRVQGASGNLQAFGFCEYKEPEHTLRAIRLLHDLTLGDKNLLVSISREVKSNIFRCYPASETKV